MSKQKKYHYIYRTTCKITGKFYVGMHSTDNLEDGYLGSGKILGYSRHKYGDENHIREIIEYCSSRDELKQREKEIVNEDLLKNPLNINLKYGGEGGDHGRTKELWSRPEYALKIKTAVIESWKKPEAKEKRLRDISNRMVEKWKNDEYSSYTLARLKSGLFTGHHHTLESKMKMIASRAGKQAGEKNSQYGKCWINDGIKSIIIKRELLDEYLKKGYNVGRKIK